MATAKRGEICPHCGQLHPKCLAHFRKTNRPCNHKPKGNLLGKGDLCRYHGGIQMAHRVKHKLLAEKKARQFLHEMEVEAIDDVPAALERAVAEAKATYEYYRDHVAQMEADKQRFESEKGIEQLRSEVALMERWHERYTMGLNALQKMRRQGDNSAGDTLLDLIRQAIDKN